MKFLNFFKKTPKDDLFNSHPDGIFVVESDGRIADVNSAVTSIFKRSRFDMVGQFFSKFIDGGSSLLNKIVKTKIPTIAKAFVNTKEEIYLELTASQNPQSGNVYVCAREVTQKHQSQTFVNAELEVCKKIVDEKNLYLTSISTDISSHLSSITGFSKALLDGIGGELSVKQEKYVQIINKNSDELDYDLGKMLEYFKLESNLYEYEEKNFDLVNHLNATIKPYEEKFKNKMLNLNYEFSPLSSRNCHHDPVVIANIIESLLEVVYKTTDVGTCSISVSNPTFEFLQSKEMDVAEDDCKKYVLIEIKDAAQSYSNTDLENIFNPYHISSELPKRPVGVKFSYAFAKAHLKNIGGKIWVYSKPMQGNYVSILIPMSVKKMASVVVKDLSKSFGEKNVLKDITLEIQDGEFCVLVGPSGCGKSTLLRIIAGLEIQDKGDVIIGSDNVNTVAPKDRDIAFVFQSYALYPHLNVFDNIAFSLKVKKTPRAQIEKKVYEVAKTLGLEELLKRKPKELSGGQRQRVALGRAIVREPKVFLMDEPLSNLDAKLRTTMRSEIKKLQQNLGTTCIYVTHDQVEALTMGDRIVVLDSGVIQQIDTPQNIYDNPVNTFVASFMGNLGMNIIPYENKLLGFRSDDIVFSGEDVLKFDVKFDFVETLGSYKIAYFMLNGVKCSAKIPQEMDTTECEICVPRDKVHYFDPETKKKVIVPFQVW